MILQDESMELYISRNDRRKPESWKINFWADSAPIRALSGFHGPQMMYYQASACAAASLCYTGCMARQPSVVLSTAEWDSLLDGEAHEVDLLNPNIQVRFQGRGSPLPAFRAAIYREAEKRWGNATVHRIGPATFRIQAHGPLRKLAAPPAAMPAPQAPAPTLTADELAEALLGPCTCGQAPTCAPNCARAGG